LRFPLASAYDLIYMGTRITRRGLLQRTALTAAAGLEAEPAAAAPELKISRTTQTHSICPYCAVGCSVVIHTLGDKAKNVKPTLVHIEGDPASPVNRGTLCPKGISLKEFVSNDRRLTQPLYRAPGASEWKPLSWSDAFSRMAKLIKDSRDKGFEQRDSQNRLVNRLGNVALIGGCTDTNEINYLLSKFRFGLGILGYENQARL
jgi:formate dehydrogenase major subunit